MEARRLRRASPCSRVQAPSSAPRPAFPQASLRWLSCALALALLLAQSACERNLSPSASESPHTEYTYTVVASYPHDPQAFTQGLISLGNDFLLESTGLVGRSSLRRVELQTGRVLKRINLPAPYFGEGIAVLRDRIYQLTWQHQKGFIYDLATLSPLGDFAYTGEGWGLTTDGAALILSDGTDTLRFLDPETFRVTHTLVVTRDGQPVPRLNELEFIEGQIYANIWQTDTLVRIDPATGRVTATIDLTGLLPAAERGADTDVLNGIAYDPTTKRLFITGKKWPRLFEIKLLPKSR
jgi:glutaminyl-peptide cyclotransferase